MKCTKCGEKLKDGLCPNCDVLSTTEEFVRNEFEKSQEALKKEKTSGWAILGSALISFSVVGYITAIFGLFAGKAFIDIVPNLSIATLLLNGSLICLFFWFMSEIRTYLIKLCDKH